MGDECVEAAEELTAKVKALEEAGREIEAEINKFNDVDTVTIDTNLGGVAVYVASEVDKMLVSVVVALAALVEVEKQ